MKNNGMQQLLSLITKNKNWEEILRNKPYCLKIRHSELNNNLVMFSYNMIDSDFYNPIVKVCRGLIIDVSIPKIICWPMNKFFNYGEPQAAKIDWDFAYRREKIDGCCEENTIISCIEGKISIKEICENTDKYHPLSFNFISQKIEGDKVMASSIKENINNWYEIILEDSRKIILTGNHRIWCNNLNCYRKVEDLDGSEDLFVIN
jgi:hypothetical protein